MNDMKQIANVTAEGENYAGSLEVRDLDLATELLKAHVADEEKTIQPLSIKISLENNKFTPLSRDDSNKILTAAQDIHEKNELNELKDQQRRHSKIGAEQAAALIAENDTILPNAQSRILELYGIPAHTFKEAQAATKLGESQNNSRAAIAIALGLPANSNREMIRAEQAIAKECKQTKLKLEEKIKVLKDATAKGQFREDLISSSGYLMEQYYDNNYHRHVNEYMYLYHDLRHLDCSIEHHPTKTFLQALWAIPKNLFKSIFGNNQVHMFTYDELYNLIEKDNKIPAIISFLEELPKEIEVEAEINSVRETTAYTDVTRITGIEFYFKLKGYNESI